ncbi:hypothetical protein TMatcc_009992 [Talaromyces marneffei ATCC 18224]|uniref:uncharacterized protein n=1 Tax=Talaromyces marneffei TaxID=37727 RepID=UPI0012A7EAFF|nr:uncharacterized protein EYB26_009209 [Talaromyces marneffei]KAE8548151.1 hypothetical protein EYB25_009945 [Talaromyces marneffei]QGA21498.1 hypothetical protein EYB26_009209 [Talaromyces marneffei]
MPRRPSCLTCRSRKAKCDRLLPRCSTCVKLNRSCLTPERKCEFVWLHFGANDILKHGANFDDGQQDRGFKFSSGRDSLLSNDERARHTAQIISSTSNTSLNAILEQIDVQSTKVNITTFNHGPFGVFQVENNTKKEVEELESVISGNRKARSDTAESRDVDNLNLSLNVDEYPDFDLDPQLWENEQTVLGSGQGDLLELFLQESDDYSNDFVTSDEHPYGSIIAMPTAFATDFSDLDMKSIGHLLDRYRNSLITSFLPVRKYHTSPWESIHVPKVHEALGEAMVSGEVTHAKMGLFFAVLGASAFHLHMQTYNMGMYDQRWKVLGENFRLRARKRLRLSLANLSTTMPAEQVADTILAFTSMYTISVVSAQLEDTYIYLREINRLIAIYGMELSRISTTLRILHNIFYYIQTMQDTVGVFSGGNLIRSPSLRAKRSILVDSVNSDSGHWSLKGFPSSDTASSILDACVCEDDSSSQSLFERVFSVPISLFQLISRVTALVHETEEVANNGTTHTNLSSLSYTVNQLETEIWDWNANVSSTSKDALSPSPTTCLHEIPFSSPAPLDTRNQPIESPLHHYIEAMHSAVLVYFYRCVRKVDPLMIQHLVDKVVESLTLCTELRQQSNDPSSDTCWALFVAGCEVLNPATRKRVKDLFAIERSRTGIRMFEKASQAAMEVWSVRDRRKNRHLSWSTVLKESNMLDGLMIS